MIVVTAAGVVARAARAAMQEAARAATPAVRRVAPRVEIRAATWAATWAEGKRAAATAAEATGCQPRSVSH